MMRNAGKPAAGAAAIVIAVGAMTGCETNRTPESAREGASFATSMAAPSTDEPAGMAHAALAELRHFAAYVNYRAALDAASSSGGGNAAQSASAASAGQEPDRRGVDLVCPASGL